MEIKKENLNTTQEEFNDELSADAQAALQGAVDSLKPHLIKYSSYDLDVDNDPAVNLALQTMSQLNRSSVLLTSEEGAGELRVISQIKKYIDDFNADSAAQNSDELNTEGVKINMYGIDANVIVKKPELFQNLNVKAILDEADYQMSIIVVENFMTIIRSNQLMAVEFLDMATRRENVHFIMPINEQDVDEFYAYRKMRDVFTKVHISPKTREETFAIYKNEAKAFEHFHDAFIDEDDLKYLIEQSDEFIHEGVLPDKIEPVLDLAMVHSREVTPDDISISDVTRDDINYALSSITSIDMDVLSSPELTLRDTLKRDVIGQDAAIEEMTRGIAAGRLNIRNRKRPVYSALVYGESGVGKTLIAKNIARSITGSEDNLLKLDMNEFKEDEVGVNRLIGLPNGYRGFESGGQLSEFVKKSPASVILLDEFEKASTGVQELFLQILDEGVLTTPKGKIDFSRTIILATSNATTKAPNSIGFGNASVPETKEDKIQKLSDEFAVELLNRFDSIIKFNKLTLKDLKAIAKQAIDASLEVASSKGYPLDISKRKKENAYNKIAKTTSNGRQAYNESAKLIEDAVIDQYL